MHKENRLKYRSINFGSFRWLVVLRIYVASAVFQPYRDLEAGDNQSQKIQVARPWIEWGHFLTQILDPLMTNMEHITYTFIKRRTCSESHVYYVLTVQCKTPPFCYIKGYDNQRASICQNNKNKFIKNKRTADYWTQSVHIIIILLLLHMYVG